MDTIIWIIGIGIPVGMLIYLVGWMVGYHASAKITNWGIGYEDGWNAHEKFTKEMGGLNHGRTEI